MYRHGPYRSTQLKVPRIPGVAFPFPTGLGQVCLFRLLLRASEQSWFLLKSISLSRGSVEVSFNRFFLSCVLAGISFPPCARKRPSLEVLQLFITCLAAPPFNSAAFVD